MKRVLVFLVTGGLLLSAFISAPIKGQNQTAPATGKQAPAPQAEQDPKPQIKFHRVGRAIPNRYIVVLNEESLGINDSISQPGDQTMDQNPDLIRQRDEAIGRKIQAKAIELVRAYRGSIGHIYKSAIKGFSAEMSEAEAIALSEHPEVKYVEEDGLVSTNDTQSNATWGIDRIDQHDRPLNFTYTHYQTGAGVNAYVIDTGIMISHSEFGNRAAVAFDAIDDDSNSSTPSNTDRLGMDGLDCQGHGTHVAGTIGGNTFGVAKGVNLRAVRVLGRNNVGATGCGSDFRLGRNAEVLAGIDFVRANHVKPAVANMSFGGGVSNAMDDAVRSLIAAGVTCTLSAGNDGVNASNQSPARVTEAITVGWTTMTDARSPDSNFGSVLDVFAPGDNIVSAGIANNTATAEKSGTSMAAPHVAGVVAMYLQSHREASPAAVSSAIANNASRDKVVNPGNGSPNRLLYSHGVAEAYTLEGDGITTWFNEYEWRESWDLAIPGNFGGDVSLTDLFLYDRTSGQGEFHTMTSSGNFSQLGSTHNWATKWDLIIPGSFGGDFRTDLLFYSRAARRGEIYATDGFGNLTLLREYTGWRNSWDMIVPGDFGGNSSTDLLFYDRTAGEGEFYTTDGSGNISMLVPTMALGKIWTLIVPGNFGGSLLWTDLLFYDRAGGQGGICTTDGQGQISALKLYSGWRKSWDMIIPADLGGWRWTDLVFYDRSAGQGELYVSDGQGSLSMQGQTRSWRNTWDLITPGNFGSFSWDDLIFYQR